MITIPVGVYMITNSGSGTAVDLSGGDSANGTKVQGWEKLSSGNFWLWDQYWFVQPVPGSSTYTLYNIKSGTVLELSNGNPANGTQAQGWARVLNPSDPNVKNQEWRFNLLAPNTYRLVNSRSGTALDLNAGGKANGTKIQGWQIIPGNPNQSWVFKRVTTP